MSTKKNIFSIIVAGGYGTRLWPVSRNKRPKQFTKLVDSNSLIQSTINRTAKFVILENIYVVLGEEHKLYLQNDLEKNQLDKNINIITEPLSRNTAPAILLGVMEIKEIDNDAIIFVFPADHIIEADENFLNQINNAIELADMGYVVTFGLQPNKPEVGYGYIQGGEESEYGSQRIIRFVEKPNLKMATQYVKSGNYYWNCGIFAFKTSTILNEYSEHIPEVFNPINFSFEKGKSIDKEIYKLIPSISIDYAVMEKTNNGVVLPSRFVWSDIGSWQSLYDYLPKDENENVIQGDVVTYGAKKSLIKSESRLVVANSVNNIAIVETDDAILISDINDTQGVKKIVNNLREQKRKEAEYHNTVYKPWGYYVDLDRGEGFRVKRIVVYPKKRISLQKHKHRSEQWVIAEGKAKVTKEDKGFILNENDCIQISAGELHRVENVGDKKLQIIEIQYGNYLEEDDIERVEDDFGRASNKMK